MSMKSLRGAAPLQPPNVMPVQRASYRSLAYRFEFNFRLIDDSLHFLLS